MTIFKRPSHLSVLLIQVTQHSMNLLTTSENQTKMLRIHNGSRSALTLPVGKYILYFENNIWLVKILHYYHY